MKKNPHVVPSLSEFQKLRDYLQAHGAKLTDLQHATGHAIADEYSRPRTRQQINLQLIGWLKTRKKKS